MNPHQYRTRFLLDISKIFIVPSILLSICLRLATIDLGLSRIPSYILFSVFIFAARVQLDTLKKRRDAYQFNARPIPCVVGKWPGNVDIMLKMLKAFKAAYIQEVYLSLFEEYQCTTLNLRVLWSDQVRHYPLNSHHTEKNPPSSMHKFVVGCIAYPHIRAPTPTQQRSFLVTCPKQLG